MAQDHKLDPRILTAQEFKLIGSTPTLDRMSDQPFMPYGLVDNSLSLKDVIRLRRKQNEIVSNAAPFMFGELDPEKSLVFKLADIDPVTGEVEDKEPKITGIYIESSSQITRDAHELAKYELTDEIREKLYLERPFAFTSGSKERLI